MAPITFKIDFDWGKLVNNFLILILVAILFMIVCFHQFLHNHEIDGTVHADCLVCIFLNFTVFDLLVGHIIIFVLYPLFFKAVQLSRKPLFKKYCRIYLSRAPPSASF